MYILHGLSITGTKILRYFDAIKYYSVKMTQWKRLLITSCFLSMKGAGLFLIYCYVAAIRAKVPTHHEQAPGYDDKIYLVRVIISICQAFHSCHRYLLSYPQSLFRSVSLMRQTGRDGHGESRVHCSRSSRLHNVHSDGPITCEFVHLCFAELLLNPKSRPCVVFFFCGVPDFV